MLRFNLITSEDQDAAFADADDRRDFGELRMEKISRSKRLRGLEEKINFYFKKKEKAGGDEEEHVEVEKQVHVELWLQFEVVPRIVLRKIVYNFITRDSRISWAAPRPRGLACVKFPPN